MSGQTGHENIPADGSRWQTLLAIVLATGIILFLIGGVPLPFTSQSEAPEVPAPVEIAVKTGEISSVALRRPSLPPDALFFDGRSIVPEFLCKVVDHNRTHLTLNELAEAVQANTGAECRLDHTYLREEGITGEENVTMVVGILWYLALSHMLENVNDVALDWRVDEGVVFITTSTAAKSLLQTRVYDVHAYLERAAFSGSNPIGVLIGMILETTTGIWSEEGEEEGQGAVNPLGSEIVVRNTFAVQKEVVGLLEALNSNAGFAWLSRPREDRAILQALEREVNFPAGKLSLHALVELIRRECGIPVKLGFAVREDGITGDELVELRDGRHSLANVLRWSLENVNDVAMLAIVDRGMLTLTTRTHADTVLANVLLDVSDLLRVPGASGQLMVLVMDHTSGIWAEDQEDEGSGGIVSFTADGRLLVRQTDKVILEVFELLTQVRALLPVEYRQAPSPAEVKTRFYLLDRVTAHGFRDSIPLHVAPGTWQVTADKPAIGLISVIPMTSQSHRPRELDQTELNSLLREPSVPVQFGGWPDLDLAVLVIRQREDVQQKIRTFMQRAYNDAEPHSSFPAPGQEFSSSPLLMPPGFGLF